MNPVFYLNGKKLPKKVQEAYRKGLTIELNFEMLFQPTNIVLSPEDRITLTDTLFLFELPNESVSIINTGNIPINIGG